MSGPKPGDRVRVTVEGRVLPHREYVIVDGALEGMRLLHPHTNATVEVLASPVYVNHDTAERLVGDVARDKHGVLWVRTANHTWWNVVEAVTYRGAEPDPNGGELTLLVRDGQVVQP